MEIIAIEENAFELVRQKHEEFINEVETICKTVRIEDQWLDNQLVCELLKYAEKRWN